MRYPTKWSHTQTIPRLGLELKGLRACRIGIGSWLSIFKALLKFGGSLEKGFLGSN